MNDCDSTGHWWSQDGPMSVHCEVCEADGIIRMVDSGEEVGPSLGLVGSSACDCGGCCPEDGASRGAA